MAVLLAKRVLLGAILGAVACASSAAGFAAEAFSDVRVQVVSFADLNLSTAQGALMLYRRVEAAARNVCDTRADTRDLAQMMRSQRCVKRAITQADFPEYMAAPAGRKAPIAQVSH